VVKARRAATNASARRSTLVSQTSALRKDLQRDLVLDLDTLARSASAGHVAQGLKVDARVRAAAAERHRDMLRRRDAPWWSQHEGVADWEPGIPDVSVADGTNAEFDDGGVDEDVRVSTVGRGSSAPGITTRRGPARSIPAATAVR